MTEKDETRVSLVERAVLHNQRPDGWRKFTCAATVLWTKAHSKLHEKTPAFKPGLRNDV